ncbi:MAG: trehalose-6-phosphate synthase [Candidatus Levyibacteriota bacterium]|nr:MAG: trehalose-6-phosphate synthase [Candidatus Levybacteria bacterium]
MRQIIIIVFLIAAIVGLVVISFSIKQVDQEEKRLSIDLQHRSTLLAESLRETVEPNFINKSDEYLQTVVEKFANKERLVGLSIFDNKGKIIAVSSSLSKETLEPQQIVSDAMDGDKANGDFVTLNDSNIYIFAVPLHDKTSVVGALMVAQNAGYIDTRIQEIWRNSLMRLSIQVFLLSIAAILFLRWVIHKPIQNIVESLKSTRIGDKSKQIPNNPFFQPLVREISNINRSLMEARFAVSEEAKLGLDKVNAPWTAERLKEFIKNVLKDQAILVVSNREPYIHTKNGGDISYFFPTSGVVTAIEPVMQACGGTWIAHGSGNADKLVVDNHDRVKVPPHEPKYTLRRVWLSEEEEKGYYYGFSNEGLWPLCHIAHTRPIFRKEDWLEYKSANEKFAKAVLQEIKNIKNPMLLIQDFHLALLPTLIKKQRPDAKIGIFWHVPWPNSESFRICPFRKELLNGILGADLVGFQTQLYCNNFIDTVGGELESLIDLEQFAVTRNGHTSYIKPFPISIAFYNGYLSEPNDKSGELDSNNILKTFDIKTKYIGLGVDRLDYTKGIIERFKAIAFFLNKYPSYKEHFTFIQVSPPSRSKIKRYQDFENDVKTEVEKINAMFQTKGWKPIIFLKKRYTHKEINEFYKIANICLVTSLHDGMNLVSKEFVASRSDEKGVLILSQFAGASRELKDALIINPYNIEQVADAIQLGLEMKESEQTIRMIKMREVVKIHNIYRWSAEFLKTLSSLA